QERGETDQPIRFQGQYRDEESGLYYNRYRYYAPELGRYVTQDPIGLMGGINIYRYVRNNAISKIDPYGLIEAVCAPEGFGSGYDDEGNKQCKYTCAFEGGTVTGILGGSQDLSQGDICYGYEVRQVVSPSGDVTTSAGPVSDFNVDTESFWDRYFRYDAVLLENIESHAKEIVK
ncbi:RHS repeat-associated core domain-containing protein, partial [Salmonella enterica subsp. enterica]|nr:RHS repeat-associated core domain-containing protein [Salmonella enterica subsp. enterica serovar Javiana]